ncbi:extracellular solute-binding protein [Paenibacillus sp. PAMC21692]|uniref:extracellular solute-binding protein n=1 Tax=Paenibacillus sp. PAMC21692 TaxID=2762320 RepID=UPI00164D3809|nr:extracellular solute-binding protein [Paenibacillus sp. PAMC21692]QNK56008.1 extracellular solute-binding protein [Paenibacillus sp. PAMC21692]
MKKLKKPKVWILATVVALTAALAGCSGNSNGEGGSAKPSPTNTAKAGEKDNAGESEDAPWVFGSEPLEFTAYTHYGWQDFPEKMEDVPLWKYLKENKQVNIKSIQAKGNHAQLMSTMMASGDLPELIYGDRYNPDIERLIDNGKIVALDPYLDKYPNLKKWLDPQLMDLLRSKDGKLYKFPNWYTNKSTNTAGYVVNKKIYNELGQPPLQTMDDLYAYLGKVKEKYGDEVVPFEPDRTVDGQGIGVLYTGFAEGNNYKSLSSDVQGVIKDNKLTSLFMDPSFRESQKFVSKLYREKLISQDMFTQDRGKVLEKLMTGRVAVYAGSGPTTYASQAHNELIKTDPEAGYFMIKPIHKAGLDQSKIHPGGYDRLGWNITTITTEAKDPEKIFAFLDWLTGPEGMTIQFFGPEGGNWKGFDENEQPIFTDQYDPAQVTEIQALNDRVMIVGNTSYIDPAKMKYENAKPPEEQNWSARYQSTITWPSANDITALNNKLNPEPDSELGDIRQKILDLITQVLAESATASSDEKVDQILDKAQADAESYGYNKLLDWRTEQWLANKKTLGME